MMVCLVTLLIIVIGDEFSGPLEEAKHGMFSYFLWKAWKVKLMQTMTRDYSRWTAILCTDQCHNSNHQVHRHLSCKEMDRCQQAYKTTYTQRLSVNSTENDLRMGLRNGPLVLTQSHCQLLPCGFLPSCQRILALWKRTVFLMARCTRLKNRLLKSLLLYITGSADSLV